MTNYIEIILQFLQQVTATEWLFILISLFILLVIIFKKTKVDISEQLKENEEAIKDELQRNRAEMGTIAKENRQELADSFGRFEQNLAVSLSQKFSHIHEQQQQANKQAVETIKEMANLMDKQLQTIHENSNKQLNENRQELSKSMTNFEQKLTDDLNQKFSQLNEQQQQSNKQAIDNIKHIENTIEKQLKSIREDNHKQLNEMRHTVDEKLQTTLEKRLGETFKQVSDRLEMVHKGLGEMQNIASNVGDLKKVLTNVKNRGVLGEYQLEAILEQMLTAEQYAKNVATKKGSQANVEFAIKLPGAAEEKPVWIPMDSKFPMEDYNRLLDAFEEGNKTDIDSTQKALVKTIEKFAKEISDKYIDPPHTTDFAVMFLPVEGIYAEVLRHPQLFEKIQRQYKITITGPTTLSAFLSSLQMGFKTLAVQKRSSEVWDILKVVKAEFSTFGDTLGKVQKSLTTASTSLENLRTTRINVMERKLRDVESLTVSKTDLLEQEN